MFELPFHSFDSWLNDTWDKEIALEIGIWGIGDPRCHGPSDGR